MGLVKKEKLRTYYIPILFSIVFLFNNRAYGQSGVVTTEKDTINTVHQESLGGVEIGHSWRSDTFKGLFFRAFYEAEIGRTFLNAGVFSYNKINDGFGFDFRLRMPWIFYPSGSHTNFSPLLGFSFTVWPVDKSTVSIGFPIGLEYEFMIEHFPNISVSANAAPLINLSAEPANTVIFDLRIGIRFD
jgi:hypothetical protein